MHVYFHVVSISFVYKVTAATVKYVFFFLFFLLNS